MKKHFSFIATVFLILLAACEPPGAKISIRAGDMQLCLDESGRIIRMAGLRTGVDHLHPDSASYLIRMRFNDEILVPRAMEYVPEESMLYFLFGNQMEVKVSVKEKEDYTVFRLHNIAGPLKPDLLIWGPYFTSIGQTIGETVGVVRNNDFAVGLQALNPRTIGGYPWLENDVMPEMDYFDQQGYSDLMKGGIAHTLYRIEAARPVAGGSALHAYCRSRHQTRSIPNWGYTNYTAPPFADGGLTGSSIALFGCQPEKVLYTIGFLELGEGLPHPKIDGQWGKTAPGASAAYMILDFSEADIDKALAYTKQAGLRYLYHSSPFSSWGHFTLKENYFPEGKKSLKNCVDRAKEKDIFIGLHTLSNFITTNDAYVSPVPDKRLAKSGASTLSHGIARNANKIQIDDPAHFKQYRNNHLKAVVIGDEIIRYAAVSETEPWILTDCVRGAFGTRAGSHLKGDSIYKLADHAYKVFLSNPELSQEIAGNIASIYNETGLRQISFDGLEGNRSTGMGNYGEILFVKTWFDQLNSKIKTHFIADASRSSHYFWHIFTRMNWGEPWYAGFRESQTEYRLKNQKYFDRNYIPNMLGWFLMKPQTSLEDIEWLLARSAAFDAGFAFVSSYEAFEKNGYTDEILSAISTWEAARMGKRFSEEQKELMEDVNNEFHLEDRGDSLLLSRIFPYRLEHENRQRQPGEPGNTSMVINNPADEQAVQLILTARKCAVVNPVIDIDRTRMLTFPVKINDGEHLKYDGNFAKVYSPEWQLLKSISVNNASLLVSPGDHFVEAGCEFIGLEGSMAVEIRLNGNKTIIK